MALEIAAGKRGIAAGFY